MKPNHKKIIAVLSEIKPYFISKGIEDIALFGSYAKEEDTLYSDIAIAIKNEIIYA